MTKLEKLSRRDPEYFEIDHANIVLLACDSCGGIGLKESDVLKAPNEIVGALTARVPILELLSLGADIKSVSLTIINEDSPTGDEIIKGVKLELKNHDVKYVISTEKNMKTSMTGLGITAMGILSEDKLRVCDQSEYMIFIAGNPSVGQEVLNNKGSILNQEMIKRLLADDSVLEIIPCGSGGIYGELLKLDLSSEDKYKESEPLIKSCGPSSAAIVLSKSNILSKYDFLRSLDEFIE